jgi:hypothetical protein
LKKFILLLVLVAVMFLVWNRQRIYLRDPLGTVARDGVKESGAQVYINYANDVLLANYNAPVYVVLVQHGDRVGTPATIHCVAYVACLLDADVATMLEGSEGAKAESMSGKVVEFRGGDGRAVVVELR